MTSDEPPELSVPVSTSVAVGFLLFFFALVVLRTAMSVYGFPTFGRRTRQTRTLHESTQIVERDSPVDLDEGPLDQELELRRRHRPGARQRQKLAPRLWSKASSFVRSKYPKGQHSVVGGPAGASGGESASQRCTNAGSEQHRIPARGFDFSQPW